MQQKTTPRDQISHIWVYLAEPRTWGDMNMGLPTIPSGLAKQVAMPKSIILAFLCCSRQTTFCNLRSLWQMFISWRAWMPTSRSSQIYLACSSQNFSLRLSMQSQRSRLPGKYSVTMQQLDLDLKKSIIRITQGISLAFCSASTSDWYFRNDFSDASILNLFIFLIANTSSGRSRCRALQTEPQVPVPRMSWGEQTQSLTDFSFQWFILCPQIEDQLIMVHDKQRISSFWFILCQQTEDQLNTSTFLSATIFLTCCYLSPNLLCGLKSRYLKQEMNLKMLCLFQTWNRAAYASPQPCDRHSWHRLMVVPSSAESERKQQIPKAATKQNTSCSTTTERKILALGTISAAQLPNQGSTKSMLQSTSIPSTGMFWRSCWGDTVRANRKVKAMSIIESPNKLGLNSLATSRRNFPLLLLTRRISSRISVAALGSQKQARLQVSSISARQTKLSLFLTTQQRMFCCLPARTSRLPMK